MFLSISRRTDICYLYSEWFLKRLEEGVFYIPDVISDSGFSILNLSEVEGMIFFTRNAKNVFIFLDKLESLKIPFYFNLSITNYKYYESFNLEEQITSLINLSKRIGKVRVRYQYGPVIINDIYSLEDNLKEFDYILSRVSEYINEVSIRFFDSFNKISKRMNSLAFSYINTNDYLEAFRKVASKYNLTLRCCMNNDYACVDVNLLEKISGKKFRYERGQTQDARCRCCYAVDLGSYNTCTKMCEFCYSFKNEEKVTKLTRSHRKDEVTLYKVPEIKLKKREYKRLESKQDTLF